jgi:hypothetical protein
MDLMRKEIEALFGKSTVTIDAGTKKFTDDDVCHYYLAGRSIFHRLFLLRGFCFIEMTGSIVVTLSF